MSGPNTRTSAPLSWKAAAFLAVAIALLAPARAGAEDATTLVEVSFRLHADEGGTPKSLRRVGEGRWQVADVQLTVQSITSTELVLVAADPRNLLKIDLTRRAIFVPRGTDSPGQWNEIAAITNVVHGATPRNPPTDPSVLIGRLFRQLDANGDELLDARDFTPGGWLALKALLDKPDDAGIAPAPFRAAMEAAHARVARELEASVPAPQPIHRERIPTDLFAAFDHDKDGVLTPGDFTGSGWDRLKELLGVARDAPLSKGEFRERLGSAVRQRQAAPEPVPDVRATPPSPAGDQALVALLRRWDANADGVVNRADFTESGWQEVLELKVDRDGNGEVSLEELRLLAR